MSRQPPTRPFDLGRTVRKFFLSAFVVFTFVAYILHEHVTNPEGAASATAPTQDPISTRRVQVAPTAQPTVPQAARSIPTATPQAVQTIPANTPQPVEPTSTIAPPPTAVVAGAYKDGEYTGSRVNAFWGLVQVKAVVQHGKLADVQFLQYPNDRRTSVRINSIAMPYLQTEAIQAQSANVDIISGATLTSEAFAQSLQLALTTAKN
jgi:uncharacterized protein with FMN-binding domain